MDVFPRWVQLHFYQLPSRTLAPFLSFPEILPDGKAFEEWKRGLVETRRDTSIASLSWMLTL